MHCLHTWCVSDEIYDGDCEITRLKIDRVSGHAHLSFEIWTLNVKCIALPYMFDCVFRLDYTTYKRDISCRMGVSCKVSRNNVARPG